MCVCVFLSNYFLDRHLEYIKRCYWGSVQQYCTDMRSFIVSIIGSVFTLGFGEGFWIVREEKREFKEVHDVDCEMSTFFFTVLLVMYWKILDGNLRVGARFFFVGSGGECMIFYMADRKSRPFVALLFLFLKLQHVFLGFGFVVSSCSVLFCPCTTQHHSFVRCCRNALEGR